MNTQVVRTFAIVSILVLGAGVSEGALYRRALTIDHSGGASTLTNIQVPVVFTPDNFDYNHVDPAGGIIRFTDTDQLTPLTYFKESWNSGGTSIFWIMVPSLPAGFKTVYVFYSTSPGELLPTPSDFAATFPNRYVLSAGNASLTGSVSYDWFQIDSPATLQVEHGSPLNVTARCAVIHGQIQARGAGNGPSTGTFTDGLGSGAGQVSVGASAGGGGYGGQGGAGFIPVAPLPPYGTSSGDEIHMGSSGASGESFPYPGGAGGGAVTITARRLNMTGTIDARGGNASTEPEYFGYFGSGGGSGGGVLLRAYDLRASGTIMVDGGDAGYGGGGGGGGGGRIKLLYEHTLVGTPILLATGGDGDTYFPAGSGAAGTIHTGSGLLLDEPVALVGPEDGVVAVESGTLDAVRVSLPTPNPSRGQVAFQIDLPYPMSFGAEIVDVQGRRVRSLGGDAQLPSGGHNLVWDHMDDAGRAVPVGVYLANFMVGGHTWTRRIVVFR